MSAATIPDDGYTVALAGLSGMGPRRLAHLLDRWAPAQAWTEVAAGRLAATDDEGLLGALGRSGNQVLDSWAREARATDPAEVWGEHVDAGVGVSGPGTIPAVLRDDPEPPAVLFHRGDLDVIAGPRVAVVGTRRCTRYGLDVATELGRDLAEAGVRVVSGLALGIDGAGHRGALSASAAPPVGVVATGLDVVYPRRHADLWSAVAQAGVLLTEAPLGTVGERWRFPARNRLIAALGDVVVVVESHQRGGSLYTVEEALRRDRPVMAVPGAVRSPSSAGTNRLLADGAAPVCGAGDVLVALGLSPAITRPTGEARTSPEGAAADVLDALGWQPATLEHLATITGLELGELSLALDRLESDAWIARRGGWFERVARPD